jgi:hypothetical protein
VNVHIINLTLLQLKLTFTGPVTQSATLSPLGIAVLSPPPGTYVISGEAVGSSNAAIKSTSWLLAAGCDYSLQLVTTSSAFALQSAR